MRYKNIIGKKFCWITVLAFAGIKNTRAQWKGICKCGAVKVYDGAHLRAGTTTSCGCRHRLWSSKHLKKYALSSKHKGKGNPAFIHGETNTPLFSKYMAMVARCNVKTSGNYKRYGQQGIKVDWKSYLEFKKDMQQSFNIHVSKYGLRNTTLDRKDPTKNYSKKNCRWATFHVQASNRRKKNSVILQPKLYLSTP